MEGSQTPDALIYPDPYGTHDRHSLEHERLLAALVHARGPRNKGQRERRRIAKAKARASGDMAVQLQDLTQHPSRGASFLSSMNPDEALRADMQTGGIEAGCWDWMKKRGYTPVTGQSEDIKVTCRYGTKMTTSLSSWLNNTIEASFGDGASLDGHGEFYESKWVVKTGRHNLNMPSGETVNCTGASASWVTISVRKAPNGQQQLVDLSAAEVSDRIRGIGPLYQSYAAEFERHSITLGAAVKLQHEDLQATLGVRDRVHRDRIMEELNKLRPPEALYDVLVVQMALALDMSWRHRFWLATLSPAPRLGQLSHHLEKILKQRLENKLGCDATATEPAGHVASGTSQ